MSAALKAACARVREDAARQRSERAADERHAQHPKLMAIIAANQPDQMQYGMAGCAQVFSGFFDPRAKKRRAAETLVYLRKNRLVLRRAGRDHHAADVRLLTKAADIRRDAARLSAQLVTPMGDRP